MNDIKLGKLIESDVDRDAIHIAVAPVVAFCDLKPGQHVGFVQDGTVGPVPDPIGVVDPFLKADVIAGQKFFMLLYQNTITNLRHDWKHPAFTEPHGAFAGASNQWLANYAEQHNLTYAQLMTGVAEYLNSEQMMDDDFNGWEVPDEFWFHYKAITGRDGKGDFWGCCV